MRKADEDTREAKYQAMRGKFMSVAVGMSAATSFETPEIMAIEDEAMERFYHAIGMPINIHELIGRDITDEEIKEMVRKCSRDYRATQGSFKVLRPEDMEAIYKMAR